MTPNCTTHHNFFYRTSGAIKHCVINKEGPIFMIGTAPFESLCELISHYEKYPLYRKTKLKFPCNQKVIIDICRLKSGEK